MEDREGLPSLVCLLVGIGILLVGSVSQILVWTSGDGGSSMFMSGGVLGGIPSGQVVAPVPLDDSCPPDSGVDVYAE